MGSSSEARNGIVVRMPERGGAAASAPARPPSSSSRSTASSERLKVPDWLSSSGKAAFRHLARHFEADAPGWLTNVDVDLLGLAVEHLAVAKAASRALRTGRGGAYVVTGVDAAHGNRDRKSPAHQVFREATAAYVALARELGLTPKARAELEVGLGLGAPADDGDDDGVLDG